MFERFPTLRYVMTEQGVAWLVEELRRMDIYHRQMRAGRVGELGFAADVVLPLKPTEYFDRNVWIGASFPSPGEAAAMRAVGVHKVMWGSDYPHHEGTYPYSLESLQRAFNDWSEADMRAVLAANAAALYGFDLDRLSPLAASHGPTVEQVATPLAEIPAKATSPAFFKAVTAAPAPARRALPRVLCAQTRRRDRKPRTEHGSRGRGLRRPRSDRAVRGFEGTVGKIFSTSEPHWPEPSIPPAGAPNVIVMMADDLGYSDLGCYGSEIDTPELDRLGRRGSALHRLPRQPDVLADAGVTAHRTQPPHGRHGHRAPHRSRLPRLRPRVA